MSTVFVFYTYEDPHAEAFQGSYIKKYLSGKLPLGWTNTGSGMACPIVVSHAETSKAKLSKYQREFQFNGPKGDAATMRDFLERKYKNAKEHGLIRAYKIVTGPMTVSKWATICPSS